jgi:hypothetical protein
MHLAGGERHDAFEPRMTAGGRGKVGLLRFAGLGAFEAPCRQRVEQLLKAHGFGRGRVRESQ